ncbi:MAG TPA: NAD(P)/FAD-dependent oxidoreductase [Thermoleophilaceae bacterium]
MSNQYDVIILGAGPAGEHCAGRLAKAGARVAIVERELVAGECAYWACIPSKTLLRSGEALAQAREAPGAAEAVSGELDVSSALAWRDFMVNDYKDDSKAQWLKSEGIELIRGEGQLAGRGRVEVDGASYGARDIVLSTGSDAAFAPIPGLDALDGLWTNREATAIKEIPGRLLVLGGGPVGVEMAQAMSRMGASVVLVEGEDHLLPREPAALGEGLRQALEAEGIEFHLGQHASGARRYGEGYALDFPDGSELRGDTLLVATGRAPRTAGIGLETVGIEPDKKGVQVDERMSAGDGLWAIGDCTGIWPFTHVGKYQARVAASNILGKRAEASYEAVPRVVFTDPEAASVGEADGEHTASAQLAEVARTSTFTRAYADQPGFLTLVSDGERLTGAYALGPEAGEWLGQATLAIRARVPVATLLDTIQPFPTFSEVYLDALTELDAKLAGTASVAAA